MFLNDLKKDKDFFHYLGSVNLQEFSTPSLYSCKELNEYKMMEFFQNEIQAGNDVSEEFFSFEKESITRVHYSWIFNKISFLQISIEEEIELRSELEIQFKKNREPLKDGSYRMFSVDNLEVGYFYVQNGIVVRNTIPNWVDLKDFNLVEYEMMKDNLSRYYFVEDFA